MVNLSCLAAAACQVFLLQFLLRSRLLATQLPVWKKVGAWCGIGLLMALPLHWGISAALAAIAAAAAAWFLFHAGKEQALLLGLLFGLFCALSSAGGQIAARLYPDSSPACADLVRVAVCYLLVLITAFTGRQWRKVLSAALQPSSQWAVSVLLCGLCIHNGGQLGSGLLDAFAFLWILSTCVLLPQTANRADAQLTAIHQQRELLRQGTMQEDYYRQLQEKQAQTRALWHDLNKYLLAAKAEAPSAQSLQQLQQALEESMEIVDVGNHVLNVILNEYVRTARAQQIELRLRIQVPPQLRIAPADLSILIGNTLDNAVEACRALPLSQRFIEVTMRTQYDVFFYRVLNPYHYRQRPADPMRGYGLDNVRRCVHRYQGALEVKEKDGFYIVSAHMNQPPNSEIKE